MKILLVEDDAETAGYVLRGLGEAGHTVDHAADGRDGLQVLQLTSPSTPGAARRPPVVPVPIAPTQLCDPGALVYRAPG